MDQPSAKVSVATDEEPQREIGPVNSNQATASADIKVHWQSIVVFGWCIGMVVMLLPVALGSLSLWRLKRNCRPAADQRSSVDGWRSLPKTGHPAQCDGPHDQSPRNSDDLGHLSADHIVAGRCNKLVKRPFAGGSIARAGARSALGLSGAMDRATGSRSVLV